MTARPFALTPPAPAETEAGTLVAPTRRPLEAVARLREAPDSYGPVASLPSAPRPWRWADVVPVTPPPPARPAGIPHPCDPKETR